MPAPKKGKVKGKIRRNNSHRSITSVVASHISAEPKIQVVKHFYNPNDPQLNIIQPPPIAVKQKPPVRHHGLPMHLSGDIPQCPRRSLPTCMQKLPPSQQTRNTSRLLQWNVQPQWSNKISTPQKQKWEAMSRMASWPRMPPPKPIAKAPILKKKKDKAHDLLEASPVSAIQPVQPDLEKKIDELANKLSQIESNIQQHEAKTYDPKRYIEAISEPLAPVATTTVASTCDVGVQSDVRPLESLFPDWDAVFPPSKSGTQILPDCLYRQKNSFISLVSRNTACIVADCSTQNTHSRPLNNSANMICTITSL